MAGITADNLAECPVQIAVVIVERAGQFLVGVRPPGVPLAGHAEFPGGKVRTGELPEEAAVRECLEETGLRVKIVAALCDVVHTYDHGTVRLYFFRGALMDASGRGAGVWPASAAGTAAAQQTANAAGTAAPQEPKQPFRWVGREELAALRFPAANAQVIEQLAGGKTDSLNREPTS